MPNALVLARRRTDGARPARGPAHRFPAQHESVRHRLIALNRRARAYPEGVTGSSVRPPAYQLLADELRADITSGRLQPGERLPPEPELCVKTGVSRSTVREALRLLARQHLIVTTRGVTGGSFVSHPDAGPLP